MDRPRIPYHPALDGLRAIAVGGVIVFHFGYQWARGGFLGVDAFFVLSGFLITSLLLAERGDTGRIAFGGFLARRARRLLPALYLMLGTVCIVAAWHMADVQLGALRSDAISSIFYYANWHFITVGQSYFDLFTNPLPLDHVWSLAIEEQFYLLWPLVVVAVLHIRRGSRGLLVGVTLGGIVASQIAMSVLYDPVNPSRAYYGTESRAHTILVGCLLALLLRTAPELPARLGPALQGFGVLAFATMIVTFDRGRASALYFHGGSLAYAFVIAMLIAALVAPNGFLRRALAIPPLRYIGRISYGLYLWHWPVIVFVNAPRTGMVGNGLNLLRLAITFAITMASYHLIEQPILRRRFAITRSRSLFPVGLALVLTAVMLGTAGAVSPDQPVGRITGGIGSCGNAPGFEIRDARAEATRLGPVVGPPPAPPVTMAVFGDSRACSLLTGLEAVGRQFDAKIGNATILGCGFVAGAISERYPMMPRDFARSCLRRVDQRGKQVLRATNPQMVLWFSGWEIDDLEAKGGDAKFGTAKHTNLLLDRMERLYRRSRAPGRKFAILTTPEEAPGQFVTQPDPAVSSRFGPVNDIYRTFAARHPDDVVIIDLARQICPTGFPCPADRDGIQPRPHDGIHFSAPGATWAAHWVWEQLLPQWPAPVAAPTTPATPTSPTGA